MLSKPYKLITFFGISIIMILAGALLFFNKMMVKEFSSTSSTLQINIEEIYTTDLMINADLFELKSNYTTNTTELKKRRERLNEIVSLLKGIENTDDEITNAVSFLKRYVEEKMTNIDIFLNLHHRNKSIFNELQLAQQNLNKNNIKYSLDGRDFYRESLFNIHMYLHYPTKDNEWRVNEDLKILHQIYTYSKTPINHIEVFMNLYEELRDNNIKMNKILSKNKDEKVSTYISLIQKLTRDHSDEKNRLARYFLGSGGAILSLLVVFLFFFIKKL